jgi:hypothetical protein
MVVRTYSAAGRLKEQTTLSPDKERAEMLLTGIADSEQLAILTAALSDYCRTNNIERGTPAQDQAALIVMALFNNGAGTAEELKAALESRAKRARRQNRSVQVPRW